MKSSSFSPLFFFLIPSSSVYNSDPYASQLPTEIWVLAEFFISDRSEALSLCQLASFHCLQSLCTRCSYIHSMFLSQHFISLSNLAPRFTASPHVASSPSTASEYSASTASSPPLRAPLLFNGQVVGTLAQPSPRVSLCVYVFIFAGNTPSKPSQSQPTCADILQSSFAVQHIPDTLQSKWFSALWQSWVKLPELNRQKFIPHRSTYFWEHIYWRSTSPPQELQSTLPPKYESHFAAPYDRSIPWKTSRQISNHLLPSKAASDFAALLIQLACNRRILMVPSLGFPQSSPLKFLRYSYLPIDPN